MRTLKHITEGMFDVEDSVDRKDWEDLGMILAEGWGMVQPDAKVVNNVYYQTGNGQQKGTPGKSVYDILGYPLKGMEFTDRNNVYFYKHFNPNTCAGYVKWTNSQRNESAIFRGDSCIFNDVDIDVQTNSAELSLIDVSMRGCNIHLKDCSGFHVTGRGDASNVLRGTKITSNIPLKHFKVFMNKSNKTQIAKLFGELHYSISNGRFTTWPAVETLKLNDIKVRKSSEFHHIGTKLIHNNLPVITREDIDKIFAWMGVDVRGVELDSFLFDFGMNQRMSAVQMNDGMNSREYYTCSLHRPM